MRSTPLLLCVATGLSTTAMAQTAGSIVQVGNTLVSAMMMFLGNTEKVYIMDKSEGNAIQIDGHPAWGSVYDLATNVATTMGFKSNAFCASGHHLPNGSWVTFGGNGAIGPPGTPFNRPMDPTYGDYDGTKAIRILNPCTTNMDATECQWFDNPDVLSMQKKRWYSTAEALADGSIVLIGGYVNGGYINRNYPNNDPAYSHGASEPTYEFYPSKGTAKVMQFMIETSGLNSYAHAFLMPSGKMFVQANLSTILWDYTNNIETPLPPMPNGVARTYPASGGAAVLPLTLANNWTPTVLFCGGQDMPERDYGNYTYPFVNTWDVPASADCQRITPEPLDGSAPVYVQDDDMLETRTMGQFITLPDGTMLMINGGQNGTAGYAEATLESPGGLATMPYGQSLAAGPTMTPALYYPNNPKGSRWSNVGLGTSTIPRLYHSSAILLPDASVFIAGSNPNIDVNTTTIFKTEYVAEIFYPPYFSAPVRPKPAGVPSKLTYGGKYFNITVPATSYTGSANSAAANTTVMVSRSGFTTHGMNMGQRLLQLNNTFTVNTDGSYVLHTSQVPPKATLLTPGPVLIFVVVNGIPSNGTYAIVGSGKFGTQPTNAVQHLPASLIASASTGSSTGSGSSGSTTTDKKNMIVLIAAIVAGVVAIAVVGGLIACCIRRRKASAANANAGATKQIPTLYAGGRGSDGPSFDGSKPGPMQSTSSVFVALQKDQVSAPRSHQAYDEGSPYDTTSYYEEYPAQPSPPARAHVQQQDGYYSHPASPQSAGQGYPQQFDGYQNVQRQEGGRQPRYY